MRIENSQLTKREIEDKIRTVGDYVKADYLTRSLKKNLDIDTKKFVLSKLAEVYESLKMHSEAAKSLRIVCELQTSSDAKIRDLLKSMELFITSGNFGEAETSFTKAFYLEKDSQKRDLINKHIEAYKKQVSELLKKGKIKNTMIVYEHFLKIKEISADDRKNAQAELLKLYEKLGKILEYNSLKRAMSTSPAPPQPLPVEKEDDFDVGGFLGSNKREERRRGSFY